MIKFENKDRNETATIEVNSAYLPTLCDAFQRFLVAAGYNYVDYKRLAKVYRELQANGGPDYDI